MFEITRIDTSGKFRLARQFALHSAYWCTLLGALLYTRGEMAKTSQSRKGEGGRGRPTKGVTRMTTLFITLVAYICNHEGTICTIFMNSLCTTSLSRLLLNIPIHCPPRRIPCKSIMFSSHLRKLCTVAHLLTALIGRPICCP